MLQSKKPLQAKTSLTAKKSLTGRPIKKRRSKRIDIKCHNLARSIWRMRGRCENCNKDGTQVQLQGAHIIGTGAAPRIGSDLRNGMCLCAMCHRYYTDQPVEFAKFISTSWAEKYYKTLFKLSKITGLPVGWEDRMDFLKEIKRAMEAKEMTIEEARNYEQDNY